MADKQGQQKRRSVDPEKQEDAPVLKKSRPTEDDQKSNEAPITQALSEIVEGVNTDDDSDSVKTAIEDDTSGREHIDWSSFAQRHGAPAFSRHRSHQDLTNVSSHSDPMCHSETDSERGLTYGSVTFADSDVDVNVDNLRMDTSDTEAPGPSGHNVSVVHRVEPDAHVAEDPADVSMKTVESSSDDNVSTNEKRDM